MAEKEPTEVSIKYILEENETEEDTPKPMVIKVATEIEENIVLDLVDLISTVDPSTPLRFYFNCLGGDLNTSVTMADIITALPNPTYGINLGKVFSGAVLPYMACDTRIAMPNADFLIHPAKTSYVDGMTLPDAYGVALFGTVLNKRYEDALTRYVGDRALIQRWLKTETYITAQDAHNLGLIDTITAEVW